MVKREHLARPDLLLQSLFPEFLVLATMVIVWYGVKWGLKPLARLSGEIKARSAGDLQPLTPPRRRKDPAAGRRAERPSRRGVGGEQP